MAFLRCFVDDDKTGGGSTFPEEVAGKNIVGNAQRKVPVNKILVCFAMVIWSIVLDYL
jgi:hypothetical protein